MPNPRVVFLLALTGIGILCLLVVVGVWASVRAGNYQIKSHPLSDLTRETVMSKTKSDRMLQDAAHSSITLPDFFQAKVKDTNKMSEQSLIGKRFLEVNDNINGVLLQDEYTTFYSDYDIKIFPIQTTPSTAASHSSSVASTFHGVTTKPKGRSNLLQPSLTLDGNSPESSLKTESSSVNTFQITEIDAMKEKNVNEILFRPIKFTAEDAAVPVTDIDYRKNTTTSTEVNRPYLNEKPVEPVTVKEDGNSWKYFAPLQHPMARFSAVNALIAQAVLEATEAPVIDSDKQRMRSKSTPRHDYKYTIRDRHSSKRRISTLNGHPRRRLKADTGIVRKEGIAITSYEPTNTPYKKNRRISTHTIAKQEITTPSEIKQDNLADIEVLNSNSDPIDTLTDEQVEDLEVYLNNVHAGLDTLDRLDDIMKIIGIETVSKDYIEKLFMEFQEKEERLISSAQPRAPISPLQLPPLPPPPMAPQVLSSKNPKTDIKSRLQSIENPPYVQSVSTIGLLGLGLVLASKNKSL
ncbi:uncharacterized protein LOC136041571 [Artemia franciscana]|uniref:uncharacterized protein LOC136041571 n=1 Tax=Artemia franciscana TaxID=6661 RepID=UPI0032DA3755